MFPFLSSLMKSDFIFSSSFLIILMVIENMMKRHDAIPKAKKNMFNNWLFVISSPHDKSISEISPIVNVIFITAASVARESIQEFPRQLRGFTHRLRVFGNIKVAPRHHGIGDDLPGQVIGELSRSDGFPDAAR